MKNKITKAAPFLGGFVDAVKSIDYIAFAHYRDSDVMTADDYIDKMRDSIRDLKQDKITIQTEVFEAMIRGAFESGSESGYSQAMVDLGK